MTPLNEYHLQLKDGGFQQDPAQARAVEHLDRLYHELINQPSSDSGVWHKLQNLFHSTPPPVTGLYLWGGVGRGKTWMMDIFYHTLPFKDKMRIHFHHFMQAVHDELTLLEGHKNPLTLVAKNFAKQVRIICLDEFHVTDITDAMLLYGLLAALFNEGVL